MAVKQAHEIPTIDVEMITLQLYDSEDEIILTTASSLQVEPQIEEEDSVKLIVKGVLKAQKPTVSTITGHTLTMTDNVFTPELVEILQGGKAVYGEDGELESYTPPVAGSNEKGKLFKLNAYSSQYTPAATIKRYEKITYPNCQGVPVAFSSEDGTFRASEYTINSAPDIGEAPYTITYTETLPVASA